MRPAMIFAFSVGVLMACGRGGGEPRAGEGARAAGRTEAQSGTPGGTGAEYVPFGPRSAERLAQDSVLRSGSRHRRKAGADST
jgi:hypothetical protein